MGTQQQAGDGQSMRISMHIPASPTCTPRARPSKPSSPSLLLLPHAGLERASQNWLHDALVPRSTKWGLRFDRVNQGARRPSSTP